MGGVLGEHTMRFVALEKLLPEIFPYENASLGDYTLLRVGEETRPHTTFVIAVVWRIISRVLKYLVLVL